MPGSTVTPRRDLIRRASAGVIRLTALAGILLVSGCNLEQDVASRGQVGGAGGPAPQVSGPYLDGSGQFDLAAERGHVVVVDFWGSWCGPCVAEQPDLSALATTYGSRGVRVVGVDMREPASAGLGFQRAAHVPYPSVADVDGSIASAYGVVAPPTLAIIDPQGRISRTVLGAMAPADVDATLDGLLTGPSASATRPAASANGSATAP